MPKTSCVKSHPQILLKKVGHLLTLLHVIRSPNKGPVKQRSARKGEFDVPEASQGPIACIYCASWFVNGEGIEKLLE